LAETAVENRGDIFLRARDQSPKAGSKEVKTDGRQRLSSKSAVQAVMLVTAGSFIAVGVIMLCALLYFHVIKVVKFTYVESYWQNLMYAFVIALANNIDNLGARIAYSFQGTKVSTLINLWISVITFAISFGAAILGRAVTGSFGTEAASVIAMVLLAGLGSWMILQTFKQPWHEQEPPEKDAASLWTVLLKPHHADVDASKHIDFKEGAVLGIALSINNIGGGLSAGIIGVSPFLVGFLSALVSFIALWSGNYVAEFFVKRGLVDRASVIGGVLLIVIGIKQVF
jgi:putative sporulation protein YtaF